ncbi:undecaprenyl-phosphate glucose phosphotransferase [uncultured Desulfosarcina sp.]|uniref:undecaprenyl-phosphate glucose phosphotransferase n=1 Tax=uncultured Desulfosarcina sp. TaxID=218289 RepID=UPI0029C948A8|nr:undecaprenyl-phosphate glucose phosphotransferase [uncultured Desulfosarcina sp.]
MENGNSRSLFIIDLIIMFTFFFAVFTHYQGATMIPLKGNILMGLIVIYWFLISVNSSILKINRLSKTINVLKDILIAYSVLSTSTIATVAIFGEFRPNDKLILYPLFFGVIASTILRLIYLVITKRFLKYGYQQKSVLLIGSGHSAKQVIAKILSTPELGFRIQGILSDRPLNPPLKELYLGKLELFPETLRKHQIDEVIIAKPLNEAPAIRRIVERCEIEGVRFCIVPDFYNIIPKWTVLNSLGDIPVIAVRNEPLSIFSNRIIKRSFDIIVSSVGLLILSPVLLIIALAIKMTSPGPILFKQKRIGNNNEEFTLVKFRSMIVQSRLDSDSLWTIPDDKRVTPFGKILRQTNLDELPQLWNVLVGDMSIVGPRPEREHFVEKFSMEFPNYRIRHRVKSGITGLAQANGWRGDTSIQRRIENDLYYLENWSLWLDLKILFLTFINREAWKNAI